MYGSQVHDHFVATAMDDLLKQGMELSFAGDLFFFSKRLSTNFGRCFHVVFLIDFLTCLRGM